MLHYTRYFVHMWELRLDKITTAAAVYFSSIILYGCYPQLHRKIGQFVTKLCTVLFLVTKVANVLLGSTKTVSKLTALSAINNNLLQPPSQWSQRCNTSFTRFQAYSGSSFLCRQFKFEYCRCMQPPHTNVNIYLECNIFTFCSDQFLFWHKISGLRARLFLLLQNVNQCMHLQALDTYGAEYTTSC